MSLELIKKIREATGAGVSDIHAALKEANNDETKTIEILRKKGQKVAAKRAEKSTNQGMIEAYVHANGRVASMVALACETDFVARTDDFKTLAHEIALQIAASAPQYLSPEEIPAEVVAKEEEIYREQLLKEGKPAAMIDKIMEGKLQKFYSEVCLLKQVYVKDDKKTIEQLVTEAVGKMGEKIKIVRFVYFTL